MTYCGRVVLRRLPGRIALRRNRFPACESLGVPTTHRGCIAFTASYELIVRYAVSRRQNSILFSIYGDRKGDPLTLVQQPGYSSSRPLARHRREPFRQCRSRLLLSGRVVSCPWRVWIAGSGIRSSDTGCL